MESLFIISFLTCMATMASSRLLDEQEAGALNVLQFGAVGDGVTDDSQAFKKAWNAVCEATSGNPTLQVPRGKSFLLKPIAFEGPCKSSNIHVQIDGNLIAPKEPWAGEDMDSWLNFKDINGFIVDGNGQIDGQGSAWWQICSQSNNADECERPTALRFDGSSNFQVSGLKHTNSQRNHISVSGCENATLSNLQITAPETSPNTDGIDISNSKKIQILNTVIATGDDCVAINTGCSDIDIIEMKCGPGHGISVGSLGENGETAEVERIQVKNSVLNGTDNGARIKTWQGGSGFARNITYENIQLFSVDNPIIIDQFYCPHKTCPTQDNAVQISDVSFIGIRGTSSTKDAIVFNCSHNVGCKNIMLNNIRITDAAGNNTSTCINAYGSYSDSIPAVDCLQKEQY